MKMRNIIQVLSVFVFASSCGNDFEEFVPPERNPGLEGGEEEVVVWHERAKEVYDLINQYYRISTGVTSGLYNENYPKKTGDGDASFLWPYDGFVSGAAAIYKLGYDIEYASLVDRFQAYYRTSGAVAVGGFGSSTNGVIGTGDRFFDDNSIVGLDMVEAYRLTGNKDYLAYAKQIVEFLKSGYDEVFGGGLWWNESLKNIPGNSNSNKPACSNSFATLFLLEYYDVCDEQEKSEVLNFAKSLYQWLKENLRDPSDGCYWNDKSASGVINQTKWTYNTGAMISNGVRLFRITGQQSFLDDAIFSAEGSYSYFVRPDTASGIPLAYPDHDPWFTIKLIRSYIDLEPYYKNAGTYINTFIDFLDHAWNEARTEEGLFFEDWTGMEPKRSEQLLMQDAALESLGIIALYKGECVDE